jgi:hypothetical protein
MRKRRPTNAVVVAAVFIGLGTGSIDAALANVPIGGNTPDHEFVAFLIKTAHESCFQWAEDAERLRNYAQEQRWTPATPDMAKKFQSTPYQLLNGWTFEFQRRSVAVMHTKNASDSSSTCSITTKGVSAQDYEELTSAWDRTVPVLRHMDKSNPKKLSHLDAIARDSSTDLSSTISYRFESGSLTIAVMVTPKSDRDSGLDRPDASKPS